MRFEYGSFQHEVGGVYISQDNRQRVRSPRGNTVSIRRRLDISGVLIASTQAAITTLMDELANAYSGDGAGGGLLLDNGSRSHHYLTTAGSLAGVQVVSGPNWGTTNGDAEYATGRSFSISLEAEYPAAKSDTLVNYIETVTVRGDGGPRYVMHEFARGSAEPEEVTSQTAVIVTQQGQATGYLGYPIIPPPMTGVGVRQGPGTIRSATSPARYGTSYINYTVSWGYEFLSSGNVSALPNAR